MIFAPHKCSNHQSETDGISPNADTPFRIKHIAAAMPAAASNISFTSSNNIYPKFSARFLTKSCTLVTIPLAARLPRSPSLFTANSDVSIV